ncbi:type VII secretion protein EssC, partial [Enterococcus gallinarum]
DPDKIIEENVDERIFMINDLGQSEVLYDPGEDVIQGKDTSELPTQLEAVIDKIDQIFQQSDYILPEKPWLPNLEDQIVTPSVKETKERKMD